MDSFGTPSLGAEEVVAKKATLKGKLGRSQPGPKPTDKFVPIARAPTPPRLNVNPRNHMGGGRPVGGSTPVFPGSPIVKSKCVFCRTWWVVDAQQAFPYSPPLPTMVTQGNPEPNLEPDNFGPPLPHPEGEPTPPPWLCAASPSSVRPRHPARPRRPQRPTTPCCSASACC